MGRVLLCILLLLPHWVAAETIDVSYGIEHFHWEEFTDNGESLLEESGLRHLVSVGSLMPYDKQWQIDIGAQFTLGTVEYDGQDSLGNSVSTDTEYHGAGLEIGFLYYPDGAPIEGESRGGIKLALGTDYWLRRITGAGGYDEQYLTTYGRLAGIYSQPSGWSLEAGARLPLYTKERVDLSDYGFADTIVLNPKGRPSLYAVVDYRIDERFVLELRVDGYRFEQSDDVEAEDNSGSIYYFHQPRSEMNTVGLFLQVAL